MARTLNEIKEYLETQLDEITLMELLNLTSSDLVAAFDNRIEILWLERRFDDLIEDDEESDDDSRCEQRQHGR